MNFKGIKLTKKSLDALRMMQSEDSEMIEMYIDSLNQCEDFLLTPEGIVPVIPAEKKINLIRLLHYLKQDLNLLIARKNE